MRTITQQNIRKKQQKQGVKFFLYYLDVGMNLLKDENKSWIKTQEEYPTTETCRKGKGTKTTLPLLHSICNRYRAVFMSSLLYQVSIIGYSSCVFLYCLVPILFIASSLILINLYRKFSPCFFYFLVGLFC